MTEVGPQSTAETPTARRMAVQFLFIFVVVGGVVLKHCFRNVEFAQARAARTRKQLVKVIWFL